MKFVLVQVCRMKSVLKRSVFLISDVSGHPPWLYYPSSINLSMIGLWSKTIYGTRLEPWFPSCLAGHHCVLEICLAWQRYGRVHPFYSSRCTSLFYVLYIIDHIRIWDPPWALYMNLLQCFLLFFPESWGLYWSLSLIYNLNVVHNHSSL